MKFSPTLPARAGLFALVLALGATQSVRAEEAAAKPDAAPKAAEPAAAKEAVPAPEIDKRAEEIAANYKPTVNDLMVAIRQDDCPHLAEMLKKGASPNQFDAFGYTPLTVAALDKRPACIQSLLEAGADVNIASAAGWTPLIGAAMSGASGQLLEILLNKGADINAQNQWGCTALYYAAGFGALPTVDFLLMRGAKYPGTGPECPTPLRIAEMRQYPAVIERLKKAEAEAGVKPAEAAPAK